MRFLYITDRDGHRFGMPFETVDLLNLLPMMFRDETVRPVIRREIEQQHPMLRHNPIVGGLWRKYKISQIARGGPLSSLCDRSEYEVELRMMADHKQRNGDKPNGDSLQFEDEKETDDLDLSGIGGGVLSENDVDYPIQFDSECKMDGDSDGVDGDGDDLDLDGIGCGLLEGKEDEFEGEQQFMVKALCDEQQFKGSKMEKLFTNSWRR